MDDLTWNVLLVYEQVPETLEFYLIEAGGDVYNKLLKCNGHYAGCDIDDPEAKELVCNWLPELISGMEPVEPPHVFDCVTLIKSGVML